MKCRQNPKYNFGPDEDACLECGEDEETVSLYNNCRENYDKQHIDVPDFPDETEDDDEEKGVSDVFNHFQDLEDRKEDK